MEPVDYTLVVDALRLAADQEILPRWRTLTDGDVRTKSGPDDLEIGRAHV